MKTLTQKIYEIQVLHEGEPASELQTNVCIKLSELAKDAASVEAANSALLAAVKDLRILAVRIHRHTKNDALTEPLVEHVMRIAESVGDTPSIFREYTEESSDMDRKNQHAKTNQELMSANSVLAEALREILKALPDYSDPRNGLLGWMKEETGPDDSPGGFHEAIFEEIVEKVETTARQALTAHKPAGGGI